MENFDSAQAQRVWQRVQQHAPVPEDSAALPQLIAGELADALTYLQLSKRMKGRPAQLLRRMYEDELSHAACLKGVYTLLTGEKLQLSPPKIRQEPVDTVLRRCYGREVHCLEAYEQRTASREYGQVYTRLAQQEREHCRILLELLGR